MKITIKPKILASQRGRTKIHQLVCSFPEHPWALYIYLPGPSKGCQMGLRGVKKNHPLGFIWHPLEGVGIFTIDFLAIHVGKSTVRPMDPV